MKYLSYLKINLLTLKLKPMTTAIEIKTFTVSYQGDMAVGENPRHYELTGPFLFQEQAELDAFKKRFATLKTIS